MTPYTIEKVNLPMPVNGRTPSLFTKVVGEMNVGDCIITSMKQSDACSRAAQAGKKYFGGAKFKTRKQPDGRTAVWRAA